jgi:hypothetical protein
LRGSRCPEDINNFWMAHKPQTMSQVYSHLHEELQLRLDEAVRVGYGFTLPACDVGSAVPIVPKLQQNSEKKQRKRLGERELVGGRGGTRTPDPLLANSKSEFGGSEAE